MKAHETLPALEEIRAFNASMRALAQHQEAAPELKLAEDMEALQAAKLAKLAGEKTELEAKNERYKDEIKKLNAAVSNAAAALSEAAK